MLRCTAVTALLVAVCLVVVTQSYAASATQDPWQVLGVRRSATKPEITRAFRRLSRQWHPDKNSSPEATQRFQEISAAYDVLTDPKKAKTLWDIQGDTAEPGSGFTATFGTVQYVLDLDPNRLRELLTTWTADWAAKNWHLIGPLWESPVERTVCWCLENAWRLPKLTEPGSRLLAPFLGVKHREGAWRAWRLSGALLELSVWSSRQAPCLQQHLAHSSSSSSVDDVVLQLEQLAQTRRKARQAAVAAAQRRQQRQKQRGSNNSFTGSTDSSSSSSKAGAGHSTDPPNAAAWSYDSRQGAVMWCILLVAAAGLFLGHDAWVFIVMLGGVSALLAAVQAGALLRDEASIQQLQELLQQGGPQVSLVGLVFMYFVLTIGVLGPLLLAAAGCVAVTWLWAAGSCLSICMTPALSQAGLALWMLLQAYSLTGGGDPIKSALLVLAATYGLWKAPSLFRWWASLLFAPATLVLAFIREVLRAAGLWRPALAAAKNPAVAGTQTGAAPHEAAAQQSPVEPAAQACQAAKQQPDQQAAQGAAHQAQKPQSVSTTSSPAHVGSDCSGGGSSKSKSRKSRRQRGKLFPSGSWWPRSFGPVDLAVTCHWYTQLLAWHLPMWVLGIISVSCKLTIAAVLLAVTAAALGNPLEALTLRNIVQLLLLRFGVVVGLLVKAAPLILHHSVAKAG